MMRPVLHVSIVLLTALLLSTGLLALFQNPVAAQTNATSYAFTYRGELSHLGQPYNGVCAFEFTLFDAATGGAQIGSAVTHNGMVVTAGVFAAELDFGPAAFDGQARWLAIHVQCADDDAFTVLTPRQKLGATPTALFALAAAWDGLSDVPADLADGDNDTTYNAGFGLTLTGQLLAVATETVQLRVNASCPVGQSIRQIHADGSVLCEVDDMADGVPGPSGPAGPAGPKGDAGEPGAVGDTGLPGAQGEKGETGDKGDQGDPGLPGEKGEKGDSGEAGPPGEPGLPGEPGAPGAAGVDGVNGIDGVDGVNGIDGIDGIDGELVAAVLSGTLLTLTSTTGVSVTVSLGGLFWQLDGNAATTHDTDFIGTTDAVSVSLKVSSTTALRLAPGLDSSDPDSEATPNLIGGATQNTIEQSEGAVIAGGGSSDFANSIAQRADFTTLSGGQGNSIANTATHSTIGGGVLNSIDNATVSTIGGGQGNVIDNGSTRSVIGGGQGNSITNDSKRSVIDGGASNTIDNNSDFSAIGGGHSNGIDGADFAYVAGRQAKARHNGVFVWADSTNADLNSDAADQFLVRANGGIWLGAATSSLTPTIDAGVFISTSTGAYLSTGGMWIDVSDRRAKTALEAVDPLSVLQGVVALPITRWQYRAEESTSRHMGPMAQDFAAAFGLGANDTTLSALDASGVALAAIQGLYGLAQIQQGRIEQQQTQITLLLARIESLEAAREENVGRTAEP